MAMNNVRFGGQYYFLPEPGSAKLFKNQTDARMFEAQIKRTHAYRQFGQSVWAEPKSGVVILDTKSPGNSYRKTLQGKEFVHPIVQHLRMDAALLRQVAHSIGNKLTANHTRSNPLIPHNLSALNSLNERLQAFENEPDAKQLLPRDQQIFYNA